MRSNSLIILGGLLVGAYVVSRLAKGKSLLGLGADERKDVPAYDDWVEACGHMIGMESHLAASAADDPSYLDALNNCRNLRRETMAQMIPENAAGAVWCMCKHAMGGCQHMREVGDKLLAEGRPEEAQAFYAGSQKMKKTALALAANAKPGAQCPVCAGG